MKSTLLTGLSYLCRVVMAGPVTFAIRVSAHRAAVEARLTDRSRRHTQSNPSLLRMPRRDPPDFGNRRKRPDGLTSAPATFKTPA